MIIFSCQKKQSFQKGDNDKKNLFSQILGVCYHLAERRRQDSILWINTLFSTDVNSHTFFADSFNSQFLSGPHEDISEQWRKDTLFFRNNVFNTHFPLWVIWLWFEVCSSFWSFFISEISDFSVSKSNFAPTWAPSHTCGRFFNSLFIIQPLALPCCHHHLNHQQPCLSIPPFPLIPTTIMGNGSISIHIKRNYRNRFTKVLENYPDHVIAII